MGARSSKTKPDDEDDDQVMTLDKDATADEGVGEEEQPPPTTPTKQSQSKRSPTKSYGRTASKSGASSGRDGERTNAAAGAIDKGGTTPTAVASGGGDASAMSTEVTAKGNGAHTSKVLEILEKRAPVKKPQLESLQTPVKRPIQINLELSSSEDESESEDGSVDGKKAAKKGGKKKKKPKKKPAPKSVPVNKTEKATISIQELKRSTPARNAQSEKEEFRTVRVVSSDDEQQGSSPGKFMAHAFDSLKRTTEVFRRNDGSRPSMLGGRTTATSTSLHDIAASWQDEPEPVEDIPPTPNKSQPPAQSNQFFEDLDDLDRVTGDALSSSAIAHSTTTTVHVSRKVNEKRSVASTNGTMDRRDKPDQPVKALETKAKSTKRLDDTDENIMNEIMADID